MNICSNNCLANKTDFSLVMVAKKIADALKVSLDYLVGKTDQQLDDDVLNRINEVSKMNDTDKGHVFSLLDAFIAKTKIKGLV
ncbi:hypothetical protein FEZ18_03500 [Oceanihabitans sp. IOP_32]|uniref:hypothetical protein n=1 Tax=Oceanihabitans sp. IOP_32 TaxID=2529032 RepID=UPI0012934BCF|nr:hypothetical protein [Oceanihabitans sp. IOP_32]QFZ53940.1 hypothetical protein FEZ18_03500 [Oceanihabitans sp. IOP_32]